MAGGKLGGAGPPPDRDLEHEAQEEGYATPLVPRIAEALDVKLRAGGAIESFAKLGDDDGVRKGARRCGRIWLVAYGVP
jgi:hypothetical protein